MASGGASQHVFTTARLEDQTFPQNRRHRRSRIIARLPFLSFALNLADRVNVDPSSDCLHLITILIGENSRLSKALAPLGKKYSVPFNVPQNYSFTNPYVSFYTRAMETSLQINSLRQNMQYMFYKRREFKFECLPVLPTFHRFHNCSSASASVASCMVPFPTSPSKR